MGFPEVVAEKQVYGASTVSLGDRLVKVRLNNSKVGEGVLEYDFPTRTNFAGSELYLRIDGGLDVLDVVCQPGFMCIEEHSEVGMNVTILRLPEYSDIPLIGVNEVATVIYDRVTSGELVINDGTTQSSSLVEVGRDVNLLDPDVTYMFAGNYNAE